MRQMVGGVTTIYGINGSCKSSIARAILEYEIRELSENNEFKYFSFLMENNVQISLSEEDKDNIWVFSEST